MPEPGTSLGRVAVVGCGYVGLAVVAALARGGRDVVAVEVDPERRRALKAGRVPVDEPGVARALAGARPRYVGAIEEAVPGAAFVVVAVPTSHDPSHDPLVDVVRTIRAALTGPAIVVIKSTVAPTGLGAIEDALGGAPDGTALVVNPEFLRQGTALEDFIAPSRLVIGGPAAAADAVLALYAGVVAEAPVVRTDARTAALAKLAANAMLAVRVGFGNELLRLSTALGADHADVLAVVGGDPRIGPAHLAPSLGFGGGCLPKDARMLVGSGAAAGAPLALVAAALRSNAEHLAWVFDAVHAELGGLGGRVVAVWGAAFKPGTDDVRGSVALSLAHALADAGAVVRVHDPAAPVPARFVAVEDPREAADGADAIVVATGWPAYGAVDPTRVRVRHRRVFDPGRALDRAAWTSAGFLVWPGRAPPR